MTHIEKALQPAHLPLAICYAQDGPTEAGLPAPVCSMLLVAQTAKGKAAARCVR